MESYERDDEPIPSDVPLMKGHADSTNATTAGDGGLAELRVLAFSHSGDSLDGFERAALGVAESHALHAGLDDAGIDAVVLSTCNRVELYWHSQDPRHDGVAVELFRRATASGNAFEGVYRARGEAAARHLFRVACGLESLMLGEGEVLGQVRTALGARNARDFLDGIFQAALRCGGQARAETAIGEGALSVASAMAQQLLAALDDVPSAHVVVVGAGSTGRRAARFLRAHGLRQLTIVNRTPSRAEALAESLEASTAPIDALPRLLGEADGLVVAAHAPAFLVTAAHVTAALHGRAGRPLVMADLSMPRAIDPAVRTIPGVTLQDMTGFETTVRENRARRQREVPRVEIIVERELKHLRSWAIQRQLRPLMADFRQRAEAIRQDELLRAVGDGLDHNELVEQLTRRLVERMIAIPIASLRNPRPESGDSCGPRCLRQPPGGSTHEQG
jgi:glutamyl-tRNA reductase